METTTAIVNRRGEVLAVATLFFFLTWATVGLRCYVRGKLMHTWGLDDTFMGITMGMFTILLAFQATAAVYGSGRHRKDLSDEDARTALFFWYMAEIFYVLANGALKFSIGYFYLRVAVQRWRLWTIKLIMAGTILFSAVYLFLAMFQCTPISEFWNNHPASAKCIAAGPTMGISYALSSVNAAADWTLGILPLFIVWGLQMRTKTKALVVGILAFAAIGSTATIVRAFYIHTLVEGPDFLFETTDVAIWSTVEPGIGITASSIATLRPLVRHCLWRMGFKSSPGHPTTSCRETSEPKKRDRRGYRRSLSPSDLVPPARGSGCSTEIQGPKANHATLYDRMITLPSMVVEEQEDDVHTQPDGYILQTVTVQQHVELPPRLHLRDSLMSSFARGSILSLEGGRNT